VSVIDPAHRSVGASVAVVIPALNEVLTIAASVASLPRDVIDQVIVVDGASTDGTAEAAVAAGATVVREPRRGYGRACLAGARAAAGAKVLVFMDGDGSDPGEQAGVLVEPIAAGRADLVVGSRVRGRRERGSLAPHQIAGNRLVAAILNRRYGLTLTDIGPFRAISAQLLSRLEMREMTYGWPTEMIRNAARARGRVIEVPVDYRRRRDGRSKVSGSARGSAAAAWQMLRVAAR
jgi:glycosyltransferase involved in cell wall biosynthesis